MPDTQNPYGSSGTNLQELWARYMQNTSDPAILAQLARYYRATPNTQNSESGKAEYDFAPAQQNVGPQGSVMIDGKPYAQVGGPDRRRGGYGSVVDDSAVTYDPEFGYVTPIANLNQTDNATRNWATAISLALGGAAFSGGALGGEALGYGSGGEAGLSRAIDPSLLSHVSGAIPAGSETALTAAPQIGSGGGLASLGEAGLSRAVDPSLLGSVSAGAPSTFATPALTASPTITGAGGGLPGFLTRNGGNLARFGLAALGSSGGGGGGGGGGGSGDANSILEQMANANRVNQNTPFGSRNWSQGPDGRWTVNDTLNPAEQANFENVQGMNADVTGMARQRLASLLASPQRPRADAPLNIRFGG